MSALFTPHVVMVTIVSVFVFVIVTIGLSYYCYRVNNSLVSMMIQLLGALLLSYKWVREVFKNKIEIRPIDAL